MGSIRLAQAMSNWLIVMAALVGSAMLAAFVCFGSVTSKARISGVLVPVGGNINIAAPNGGTLIRTLVEEGQNVRVGQPLFELSTARHSDHGEMTALLEQQLLHRRRAVEVERRLVATSYAERQQSLTDKLSNLRSEDEQLEQEGALIERRLALAQDSLAKYQSLRQNGYVSIQQLQQKQEELIDVETRRSTLRRSRLQVQANMLAARSDQAALAHTLAAEQAQANMSLATVEQEMVENRNRKSSLIIAPHDGTVAGINFPQGQAVVGGQVLATLIPTSGKQFVLEAHLYAPSRAAGFVKVGQAVQLRLQSFPYQKFGLQHGVVTDVSRVPFAPAELQSAVAGMLTNSAVQNMGMLNAGEPMYRIKVRLERQDIAAYGQRQPLKPGMSLEADVVRDTRKIWEWLAEPILATAQR